MACKGEFLKFYVVFWFLNDSIMSIRFIIVFKSSIQIIVLGGALRIIH